MMTIFISCFYYSLGIVLVLNTKHLLAYPCHVCDPMSFNYSITIDGLPSPTGETCKVITSETGCFVRVNWYDNEESEVLYGTNPGFPYDSVVVETQRRISAASGLHITYQFFAFICGSSDATPCNTVEHITRGYISTTLPTKSQIEEYDELLLPTEKFDSNSCFLSTNMTDDCPKTDLVNCQKCLGFIEYSQQAFVCAACPVDEIIWNFFQHTTTFLLNNRTHSGTTLIRCENGVACNSMNNMETIQRNLMPKFDFNKFFNTATLTTTSSLILSFISLCIVLPRVF